MSRNAKLAIDGKAEVSLTCEPLFESIGKSNGLGAAAPANWFRVTADVGTDAKNPWDACHDLMKTGALEGVEFIEPDSATEMARRPSSAQRNAFRNCGR